MSFDAVAPHYRWMERVFAGGRLQRCRTALLPVLREPRHALIYGEGNGRFLVEFCRRFPNSEVTVVDASQTMLTLARQRLQQAGGHAAVRPKALHWVHADALLWQPPEGAHDLIVTCFFLDCFDAAQLRRLVPAIATGATADAQWLVADFQLAPAGWRRLRSRLTLVLLYAFFRRTARVAAHVLVDPAPLLRAEGFQPHARAVLDLARMHATLHARGGGAAGS